MKKSSRFHRRLLTGLLGALVLPGLVWVGLWLVFEAFWGGLSPLGRGLLALGGTLGFLVVTALVWGSLAAKRRPDVFGPFNDALKQIAQGDYRVTVAMPKDVRGPPPEPFQTMADNINAMAEALVRVETLRRQFVSDVSHEFQSPLTSILGFAQALKNPDLPPPLRDRYLSIVETEARRLSRLADGLLRLNSLEDRDGPPDPVWFRLDVLLRRVLVSLEPQWMAQDLDIAADLHPIETRGNEELWTQVWTNLLHNAIKFTPPGGRILVRLTGDNGWVAEVEDSGIGLTEVEASRVFERFYKADSSRTQGEYAGGNGLGLALVHRIVTLHGARVEALSPGPGRGTTLRVSMPPRGP